MPDVLKKFLMRFRPSRITSRERRFLVMAGVAALVMMTYGIYSGVSAYTGKMEKLDRQISRKKNDLEELEKIKARFEQLNSQVGLLDQRIHQNEQDNFSLLSFLETLAARTNIRSKIAYMRPKGGTATDLYKEISVEMKIESVNLNEAIRFLNSIESAPHVLRIKNLHFKTRYANPEFLDVNFLVSTYEPVG